MLKLKYLFHNKELAEMILKNWEYDCDDPDLLKYYRTSSNAVYWCKNNGNIFFLRFAPDEEKSKENILAELEFLRYLKSNGYSSVETILSKAGNELEVANTPWWKYYAVAFKKASGMSLDRMPLTKDIVFGFGKALGKLHKLSSEFNPINNKRNTWKEEMDWMENILTTFPNETEAKNELSKLRDYFSKLPATKYNFGLVHYDFELDNVFYDEASKTFTAIDFDDSMYNWYALDIEQSLDSLKEEISEDQIDSLTTEFINGYRLEYDVWDEMLKLLPIFRRYINLYDYVRVLHSSKEKWDNEPGWLVNLRSKLETASNNKKAGFAMPL